MPLASERPYAVRTVLHAQFAAQPLDQPQRHHRRSRHHQAQGRQVVGVAGRVVQEGLVEGRRAGEDRDAFRGDVGQDRVDVEHRLGDHRRAPHQAGDHPGLVTEGVEEGVDDQIAVAPREARQVAPDLVRPQRLRVGDHRALGAARRAGGEDDVGGPGPLARPRPSPAPPPLPPLPARQEVLPGAEVGRGVVREDHHLFRAVSRAAGRCPGPPAPPGAATPRTTCRGRCRSRTAAGPRCGAVHRPPRRP